MSEVPTFEALGEVAVMVESFMTTTFVAGVPLKVTDVAPLNPVPEMVTLVPPEGDPEFGETPATAGTGAGLVVMVAEVSTRVLELLPVPVVKPTAVQAEAEVHETPYRVGGPAGTGATDQAVPFHCSMRLPCV
jgi:hypothetical protein